MKSWLSIEGKSVYMFTSTCVNTQGKERQISIWKCQMWLRALKWDRAGLRSKGSADLESVSHCLFCLGVTLGRHGLKIYWEPQKHIWVSHFTDFTFLLHSCRIAPKEQHQFPLVPFRPCSKTWSLWQRRFMHQGDTQTNYVQPSESHHFCAHACILKENLQEDQKQD